MAIQIELNPEMEAQLAAEARARGIDVESYARLLLQEAIAAKASHRSRASQEDFRAFLDAFAAKTPDAPHLLDRSLFARDDLWRA